MKVRVAALMAIAFGASWVNASRAQGLGPADGAYLRLEGGWSHAQTMSATGIGTLNFQAAPDEGYILGGAAGLIWRPFRFELGLDIDRYSMKSIRYGNDAGLGASRGTGPLNGSTVSLDGNAQNIAVMVNGFYDLPNTTRFKPYVGGGLGFTSFTLDSLTTTGLAHNALLIDSSQRVFAYQAMIGVNYALTDRLDIGGGYRYFASVDPSLSDTAGHRFLVHNESHNLLVTLTYHFGVPEAPQTAAVIAAAPPPTVAAPPAVAPAPAAQPSAKPDRETFLVFFDFDEATLTQAGRQMIDTAVAAYHHDTSARIELTGYTDLVGSEAYNLALSRRRAMTVYHYMLSKGVAASDLGVAWRGKADPVVPTPQREPQNRRVSIVMP